MSSRSTKSKVSDASAQLGVFAKSDHLDSDPGACNLFQRSTKRLTIGGRHHQRREPLLTAQFDVRACRGQRRCPRRSSAWRRPRIPTLRNASTQGRTTSALPGAMLVKTVASGWITTPGRLALTSAVRASSQRPSASNRGRSMAVGRRPKMEPRPMSRLGASQTSKTRPPDGGKLRRPSPESTGGDVAASGAVVVSSVKLMVIAFSR